MRDHGSNMYAFGVDVDSNDLVEMLNKARDIVGDNSALSAGKGETKFRMRPER